MTFDIPLMRNLSLIPPVQNSYGHVLQLVWQIQEFIKKKPGPDQLGS
jgi:hypothetical protein